MDQAVLVTDMVGAGEDLIEHLRAARFPLRDAFWAFDVENDGWYLYLVNPAVDQEGFRPSIGVVHDVVRGLESWRDRSVFDIRVAGTRDPIAKAVGAYVDRYPPRVNGPLMRVTGLRAGDGILKEAFIYPR